MKRHARRPGREAPPRRRLAELRRSTLGVGLVALATGCGDTTGSAPSVDVTMNALAAPPVLVAREGRFLLECEVQFTATASGSAGTYAEWKGASIRMDYSGGAASTDTTLSSEEVRRAWGSPRIPAGGTIVSRWSFQSPLPARVSGHFAYRPGGRSRERRAEFAFGCERDVPRSGLPSIYDVHVSPTSGEVESAVSTISLTYTAASSLGLAETGVRLSGAFSQVERRPLNGGTEVTVTQNIRVPRVPRLGEWVRIQLYAVDLAGREFALPADSLRVVDTRPPWIAWVYLEPNLTPDRFVGNYTTGDTLKLRLLVSDDHRLTHLVYALGAPANVRDSIALAEDAPALQHLAIPIHPDWVGAPTLTVYARDAAGLTSKLFTSPPDSLRIYPEVRRPTRSTEIAGAFEDVAVDAVRDYLYLALPGAGAVAFVRLSDLKTSTRITLPGRPGSLDLSPDGSSLVVGLAQARALALLDPTRPGDPPRVIPLDGLASGFEPRAVRFTARGTVMVWAVNHSSWQGEFLEYDPAGNRQTVRGTPLPAGVYPGAARSQDYRRLAFNVSESCALVYDGASDSFGPCRAVGSEGRLSAAADGSRFSKGFSVYDAALQPVRALRFEPFSTYTTGLSADGAELFISNRDGLIRSRLTDGFPTERISLPPVYKGAIVFTRGGRSLVTVGGEPESNPTLTRIHVVDLD